MVVLVVLRRQMYIPLKALAGYFFICTCRAVLNFISKKKIFFPSCGNNDFTNHGACCGQCYWGVFCRDHLTACQRRCRGTLTENTKPGYSFSFGILCVSSTSKSLHRRLPAIWLFRVLTEGEKESQYCFCCNEEKHTVQLTSGGWSGFLQSFITTYIQHL